METHCGSQTARNAMTNDKIALLLPKVIFSFFITIAYCVSKESHQIASFVSRVCFLENCVVT